jgi:DNA-binding response OmpR family regulator
MRKILLVEDESTVASFIRRGLTENGYEVTVAMDGNTGLEIITNNSFDLILLDIMLPGINGLELCRRIRSQKILTPVLMLTALGSTENIVTGLDIGADDYLVKPFKLAELEARIRTLLRRSNNGVSEVLNTLQLSNLQMDLVAKTVNRNGQPVQLTSTEFRLLEFLLRNKKRVISRLEILENVWSIDFNMGTNVVDVYVNYLRKKIDKDFDPKLIHTIVGMGYVMREG